MGGVSVKKLGTTPALQGAGIAGGRWTLYMSEVLGRMSRPLVGDDSGPTK